MNKQIVYRSLAVAIVALSFTRCKIPAAVKPREEKRTVPASYSGTSETDTSNMATLQWRNYFSDPYLVALIDTALKNNQELNITVQELEIARNEIRARKGEYLPFLGLRGGAGVDKVARYTNIGAMEANTQIKPGKEMPEPLPDYMFSAYASWEIDIWRKLRNAKKAASLRYIASMEGRNFTITNLIAEIADNYYELLALDNQLEIVKRNVEIQSNVLRIVKLQKEAAKVTELAVRRFQAQVLNTQSLQYGIQQRIVETENEINFLLGRFPQHVDRDVAGFERLTPAAVRAGLPVQLLDNRPDIRRAEQELAAAKLDVKVAKARFYPSLGLNAQIGYQAFDPAYLLKTPESLLYSIAGDLAAPIVNRNGIKAAYYSANARQMQAVYNYERTVLNAYIEVANQVSNMKNLDSTYSIKSNQVETLAQSVTISNDLFRSARADYMEVLMTQRDALEARFDLIETKMKQMNATVNIYRALGGGWK
ncbi:MAG: efflux transporter outer membrane subunit [Chitinophagaceae bacterium]